MSPTHSLDLRLIFYCLFSTVYCLLLTICELPSISPWYHSNTEIRDAVEQYTEDFNKNLLPTHSPDLRLIFFFLWLLSTNYCLLPSAYHTLPYHSNMEIRDAVEQYTHIHPLTYHNTFSWSTPDLLPTTTKYCLLSSAYHTIPYHTIATWRYETQSNNTPKTSTKTCLTLWLPKPAIATTNSCCSSCWRDEGMRRMSQWGDNTVCLHSHAVCWHTLSIDTYCQQLTHTILTLLTYTILTLDVWAYEVITHAVDKRSRLAHAVNSWHTPYSLCWHTLQLCWHTISSIDTQ